MSIFAWISVISVALGIFFLFAFSLNTDYYCKIKRKIFGVLLAICLVSSAVNIPLAIIDKTNGRKEVWVQQETIISKWVETISSDEDKFCFGTDSGIDFRVSGRTYGKYEKGDEVVVRYERIYGKFSNHLYEEVRIEEGE